MYVSLYNCMQHNTPFYMFNKDNMEHVTQVKQGHVMWLRLKFWPYEMSFKTTVTLFLGK